NVTGMRQIATAIAAADANTQSGATCEIRCRSVASILYQVAVPKCIHCSRRLTEEEPDVTIEGERFHDACLRRLITDEKIRLSRALSRRSQDLIERSRERIRAGHRWPPLDVSSN